MAGSTKLTVALALESSNFSKQITAVNKELKLNEAQFKQASSGVQGFERTQQGAEAKVAHFSTALEQQGKKTQLYKTEIGKTKEELTRLTKEHQTSAAGLKTMNSTLSMLEKTYGKNSTQVAAYKEKVAAAGQEHQKIGASIVSTSSRLTTLDTELAKSQTAWNGYSQNLNRAQQELNSFNVSRARQSLNDFGQSMQQVSGKFGEAGSKISAVGESLDNTIGQPLMNIGKASMKVGMDFESSMSTVRALSGATGEDFTKLKEKAKEMGASTTKTAKQSADALGYMALAGWDTSQMMSGLEPVLKLSESGAMDLAKASDLVTDTMGGLGLTADDLSGYLDKVAKTSTMTNTSTQQLLEGFLNVGSTATSLDIPLNELSATMGILANNGLKGKSAGTKLNAMLTRMTAQSGPAADAWDKLGVKVFDTNGKFRGMEPVLNDTRVALGRFNDEQQQTILKAIMGTYNITPFRNLINSTGEEATKTGKSFRDFSNGIEDSDQALNKMREIMQDNTQGSLEKFKSSLEGIGIKISEVLLPALTPLLDGLTKALDTFGKLPKPVQEGIVKFGLFTVVTTKVIKGVGGTANAISTLTGGLGKMSRGLASGTGVLGTIGNLFLRSGGAAATMAGGVGAATTSMAGAAGAAGAAGTALAGAGAGAASAGGALAGAGTAAATFGGAFLTALPWIAAGAAVIGGTTLAVKSLAGDFNDDAVPAVDLFADHVEKASETVQVGNKYMQQETEKTTIKISDSTKQLVGAYMDLDTQATKHMWDFNMKQSIISDDIKTKTIGKFNELTKGVVFENDDMKQKYLNGFSEMMMGSIDYSQQTRDNVVSKVWEMVNMNKNLTEQQKNDTVNKFMDTFNQSNAITEEGAKGIFGKYDALRQNVDSVLTTQYTSQRDMLIAHFAESTALTDEQEKAMLESLKQNYIKETETTKGYQDQINKIIENAYKQKRDMTDEEKIQIGKIQEEMRVNAVQKLSSQEEESKLILGRMKGNQNRLTVEMVSENIKTLNKGRDDAIKAAQDECTQKLIKYDQMRKTLGPEQSGFVDTLVAEAERSRDLQIKAAEDLRTKAVGEMKQMGGEMVKQVNTDTGAIKIELNGFQKWWNSISFMPKFLKFKEERTIETKQVSTPAPKAAAAATYSMMDGNIVEAYAAQRTRMSDGLSRLKESTFIPDKKSYKKSPGFNMTTVNGNNSSSVSSSNSDLLRAIQGQNEILTKVVDLLTSNKDVNVSLDVDGRKLAKATAKYMGNELDILSRRKSRLGGAI